MILREDELAHYGVPGMKWGVRRNARSLETHRRNRDVDDIKNRYLRGEIDAITKKQMVKSRNAEVKTNIAKTMQRYNAASTHSKESARNFANNLELKAKNEVPHNTVKKNVRTAIHGLEAYRIIAETVGAGMAFVSIAPLAGVGVAAAASTAGLAAGYAVTAGMAYVANKINDRLH